RDHFAIAFDKDEIKERIRLMRSRQLSDADLRTRFNLRDNRDWQLSRARKQLRGDPNWADSILLSSYRPFDRRWCYFSTVAMDYPRRELLDHVAQKPNLCLNIVRQTKMSDWQHAVASKAPTPALFVEIKDGSTVFPGYLYPDIKNATLFDRQKPTDAPGGRRPNLAPEFIAALSETLGLRFVPDGCGDLLATFGPEDVLHYTYAVLHSPAYRTRYAGFLKIDFPRLPLTSDRALFARLVGLGADLVALHLLEDDYPAASWNQGGRPRGSPLRRPTTTFVERATGTTVGAFGKSTCYQDGCVYLDTSQRARSSYFEGVPAEVWNFQVGGYQVLYKWLYDRRGAGGEPGRTLTEEDVAHYQRIVVALQETMRLMGEIDAVIEAHGGWPIE
ncbi:MAG: hypothetical protein JXM73_25165, partial [Anaerolineae bacterium]|nr:hypothetical protein [Anaerolineae bacterium]